MQQPAPHFVRRVSCPHHHTSCLPPSLYFLTHLQDCNAAAGSTDYETWQLPAPGQCLLGAKYSMQRRKRDAGCFNTGVRSFVPCFLLCSLSCFRAVASLERNADVLCLADPRELRLTVCCDTARPIVQCRQLQRAGQPDGAVRVHGCRCR